MTALTCLSVRKKLPSQHSRPGAHARAGTTSRTTAVIRGRMRVDMGAELCLSESRCKTYLGVTFPNKAVGHLTVVVLSMLAFPSRGEL